MPPLWQEYAAIGVVGASLIYLGRLAYRAMSARAAGCGTGCGSCPSKARGAGRNAPDAEPLVSLGDHRDRDR